MCLQILNAIELIHLVKPFDDILVNNIGALHQLSSLGAGLSHAVAIVQRLVAEGVQVGKRICHAYHDLRLDAVVVVLGALCKDVLHAAGLARVKQTVPVEVVRLEKLDPVQNMEKLLDVFGSSVVYHFLNTRRL